MHLKIRHIILYRETIIIAFLILICIPPLFSQVHIRSSTLIEGSVLSVSPFDFRVPYPDRPIIDQSLYWRPKNIPNGYEKTFYNMHSVYLRDSMIGIGLFGIDYDLMNNTFKKRGPNFFRYWNKLRMGFLFMLEKNYNHPWYPKGERYNYINGEVYLSCTFHL